jgi:hypothetical protein
MKGAVGKEGKERRRLALHLVNAAGPHMNRREPAAVATALAALTIVVATFR